MKSLCPSMLALASLLAVVTAQGQTYATKVEAYSPGIGFTAGYTNAAAALGAPARENADPQFGTFPIDPFGPAYLKTDLVSLGTNGSLTLSFDPPIVNRNQTTFGLDFIVFGNAGFTITNKDFGGGGITDGSLFGSGANTRVSVSADGTNYYLLNPTLAPDFDALFPTDGAGDFSIPVNPALKATNFSGKTLTGMKTLYAGSGGGTGYDLSWAQDSQGYAVNLSLARYVKLEVLTGQADIDAVAVIPEPLSGSPTFEETLTSDPSTRGWSKLGEPSLFQWNSTSNFLAVTWDSSKTNSAYYRRLGTILSKDDNFSLEFDLVLNSIAIGTSPNKPSTFQIAVGFFNTTSFASTNLLRGSGVAANLAEFNYFPDSGFGATISPTLISSSNIFASGFDFPFEMTTNDLFHVAMNYTATNRVLTTSMTRNGLPFGPLTPVTQPTNFTDLRLDAVGVISYSDAVIQSSPFDGSILAKGEIRHLSVVAPSAPVSGLGTILSATQRGVKFQGNSGWRYLLQRSADLRSWQSASAALDLPAAGSVTLLDTNTAGATAFYRVQAQRP